MTQQDRPHPHFPGGPDPTRPVPRAAVDGLDVTAYARLSAQLASNPRGRNAVLAANQLDERRWMAIEKVWLLRLATAAMQRDLSLQHDHDHAFQEAKTQLGA